MSPFDTHRWQEGKPVVKYINKPKIGKVLRRYREDLCVVCACRLLRKFYGKDREAREYGTQYVTWQLGDAGGRMDRLPVCSDPFVPKGGSYTQQHQWFWEDGAWRTGTHESLKIHKLTHGMIRYVSCPCGLVRKDVKGHYRRGSRSYNSYFGETMDPLCPPCPLYSTQIIEP